MVRDSTDAAARFAENYDATLVPVVFRPWARELISRVRPGDGEAVLDLACGTGAVTGEIIQSGIRPARIVGADISEGMLSVARSAAPETDVPVTWLQSDASDLPLEDGVFDVALCQQALQFFPDRPAALAELRRVMRRDGRVAFCVQRELELNPLLRAQAAALDKHVGTEAGDAVRAICSLPDGNEVRRLFEGAGFGSVEVETVTLILSHGDGRGFAAGAMGGMHSGDKLSRTGDAERNAAIDDFLDGLGECFDGTGIRFPHVSTVVTAKA